GLAFGEHHRQLVVLDRGGIDSFDLLDERRTERGERLERALREPVQAVIRVVTGEMPAIDADPRSAQGTRPKERSIVAWESVPDHLTERRADGAQEDRRIGDRPAHRPDGVLTVRDGD